MESRAPHTHTHPHTQTHRHTHTHTPTDTRTHTTLHVTLIDLQLIFLIFHLPGANHTPLPAGINAGSITYIGVEHGVDLLGIRELAEVPVPVQKGLGTVQDLHGAFTDSL